MQARVTGMPRLLRRCALSGLPAFAAFICVVLTGNAQAVQFKHFHHYPPGEYRQEGQGALNGTALSKPVVETRCAAPLSPQGYAAAKSLGDQAGAMNNCTVKILEDTPMVAEYVQTCNAGAAQTVIHTALHAVDDRTMKVDTNMTAAGRPTIESHSTSTYLGPCTAGPTGVATVPKPSKEDCAQIAEMKQQAQESAGSCAQVPAEYKARCEASLKVGQERVQQLVAMCQGN